jgi:hypothetical protein
VTDSWACSVCGEPHEGLPLDWGFDAPAYWDEERAPPRSGNARRKRSLRVPGEDEKGHDYFVRGLIEFPIIYGSTDDEAYFGIGAWASLSEEHFHWYLEHFEADGDEQGGTWFGWLSNSIPVYPETLNLRTDVVLLGRGLRPSIRIQPSDHPLSIDQQNGITLDHARELSATWMHS